MGFVRAYLRVSTIGQDVMRAKEEITQFAKSHQQQISGFYYERFTGTSLNRPELNRLLSDASRGDIILIESVDRISRLNNADWLQLKRTIESKGISIVAIDLPTSHVALKQTTESDPFIQAVLKGVNGMLLDILAATARKDYDLRRKRNQILWSSIKKLLETSHTYSVIQQLTGASRMTIANVSKEMKKESNHESQAT